MSLVFLQGLDIYLSLRKVLYLSGFLFFLLTITRSSHLAKVRWYVCQSKSQTSLCVLFFRIDSRLCIYPLFVWSNLNFLHISQWIPLLTQSCLVLYSFCANLLRSLIMWLMVSSLSPHRLHLLFCWVLSILALIWLVLKALICAAIRRDSVSFLARSRFSRVRLLLSLLLLLLLLLLLFWDFHCRSNEFFTEFWEKKSILVCQYLNWVY